MRIYITVHLAGYVVRDLDLSQLRLGLHGWVLSSGRKLIMTSIVSSLVLSWIFPMILGFCRRSIRP